MLTDTPQTGKTSFSPLVSMYNNLIIMACSPASSSPILQKTQMRSWSSPLLKLLETL